MDIQVWHDQKAVHVLGLNVSSIDFTLSSDSSKDLPASFRLLIVVRVLGVQIGTVTVDPMKNGTVTVPLIATIGGAIDGRIDNWGALDKSGKPVDDAADPHWKSAEAVGFLVTGLADVTIDAAAVAGLIPVIGGLAKAALAILGNRVKVTIAHEQVVAHLPHGTPAAVSVSTAAGAVAV